MTSCVDKKTSFAETETEKGLLVVSVIVDFGLGLGFGLGFGCRVCCGGGGWRGGGRAGGACFAGGCTVSRFIIDPASGGAGEGKGWRGV